MKILIIRFSSIGDIVLTTPVVRCLKQQVHGAEIHYISKQSFRQVIEHNPYIDRFFFIQSSVKEVLPLLKKEQYDYVIDLHHNTRTLQLKLALGAKSFSFDKLNKEKFMLVHFHVNRLPEKHIVDRYFEAIQTLGITNDRKGLDYFIDPRDEINIETFLPEAFHRGYYALVAGGSYYTKRIPENKLKEICTAVKQPLVILGGPEDAAIAQQIQDAFPGKVFNVCGKVKLNQSASLIRQALHVISSDTGLMHIAAAYKKTITSIWGNTIPEFGMYPYLPGEGSTILEVKNLKCRPCSKLGFRKCPKGHFRCMNEIKIPGQL